MSYGHDGLLNIFHCLFQKYPLLGRIIADRYDFIFIDEYQDTRAEVLSDLLTLPAAYGITIALFGDSMQSIYEDGVGDVEEYVKDLCKSFNRFLIISLDVLICRYSPLLRAFPALFISEEPHKSFYYPSCFHSQK